MNKPSGKLLFAYQTIASLEQKLETAQARVAELEKQEPFAFYYHGEPGYTALLLAGMPEPKGEGFERIVRKLPLYAAQAAQAAQAGQVPDGWRVMRCTSSIQREGDQWEIYDPQGSGGVVSVHDVKDWVVRGLLDALAAAPAQGGE